MSKGEWPVGVVDVSDFSGGSPLYATQLQYERSLRVLLAMRCSSDAQLRKYPHRCRSGVQGILSLIKFYNFWLAHVEVLH